MFDRANQRHLGVLARRLSSERLKPYVTTAGSLSDGIRLYEWNAEASAAMYGSLQVVEIVLRNALHDQLAARHGRMGLAGQWFDDPLGLLEVRCLGDIAEARARVAQAGYAESPARVVSELSFGFWRILLSGRYHNVLWVPVLRHAFPAMRPQRRREIHEPVARLNRLRNRIAHHEPIHCRDLRRDHADALKIISAICPLTMAWARQTSSVPEMLAAHPFVPSPRRPN